MSPKASNHKSTSTRRTGDNATSLNGWKHMGYYGSQLIYGLDNKRRLVNPKTGRTTFEYMVGIWGVEHGENIE